jgi:hypothetical protein
MCGRCACRSLLRLVLSCSEPLRHLVHNLQISVGRGGRTLRQIRPATKLTRMLSIDDLLKGHHFDQEIIILFVRGYLRFKLSFRDLVAMMAKRGISLHIRQSCGSNAMFRNSKSGGTASRAGWRSRKVRQDQRPSDLSLPRGRQRGKDCRFLVAREARCERSGARGGYRIRSRSMVIRPHIARSE